MTYPVALNKTKGVAAALNEAIANHMQGKTSAKDKFEPGSGYADAKELTI